MKRHQKHWVNTSNHYIHTHYCNQFSVINLLYEFRVIFYLENDYIFDHLPVSH